jgi:hypothetical protein
MTLQTWIWLVFIIVFFAALWLFARWADRSWPETTQLLRERGELTSDKDIPE